MKFIIFSLKKKFAVKKIKYKINFRKCIKLKSKIELKILLKKIQLFTRYITLQLEQITIQHPLVKHILVA